MKSEISEIILPFVKYVKNEYRVFHETEEDNDSYGKVFKDYPSAFKYYLKELKKAKDDDYVAIEMWDTYYDKNDEELDVYTRWIL